MRLHDGPQGAAPTSPIARGLSFVELMELLEFSRLRFEAPAAGASATLIGTQEWHLGIDADGLPPSDIYICSTLEALRDAVLPPADAELRIDTPSLDFIRLMATARAGNPAAPAVPARGLAGVDSPGAGRRRSAGPFVRPGPPGRHGAPVDRRRAGMNPLSRNPGRDRQPD